MSEADDATLPHVIGPPPEPTASIDLGERYEVGPVIGRGGMGEIRLARDSRIEREVAVKLMRGYGGDIATARFFREARIQGVLDHPAVVPVHDLGVDPEGNPFFVMKRLAGITLADVLVTTDDAVRSRWPRRQLLARLVDVCLAIEFAHTRGVIHRDLKPANIMLGDFGEAYVLDWGLARMIGPRAATFDPVAPPAGGEGETRAGELLGTPGYMSPEQVRGEPVDARTDVFALGCILYEILAGKPALPRGLEAIAATLEATCHRPSEAAEDVALELDDVCGRATGADRVTRPTARELSDGIQAYLDGDRDVARRCELAEAHAQSARCALADTSDDGRAGAMRDAGRALALDPENSIAQGVLGHLLLEIPRTVPAEALASADEERGRIRQNVLRKVAWGYLAGAAAYACLLLLPLKHAWPVGLAIALSVVAFGLSWTMARRPLPMRSRWFIVILFTNVSIVTYLGILFGPLLIMPIFVVASLAGFVSQSVAYRPWIIIAVHLLPFVTLLGLEWGGVLPASFHIANHTLQLGSWAFDVTKQLVAVGFVVAMVSVIASTVDIHLGFRRASEQAQNRIHSQSWHLRQLLPRAAGEVDTTKRTPRS